MSSVGTVRKLVLLVVLDHLEIPAMYKKDSVQKAI